MKIGKMILVFMLMALILTSPVSVYANETVTIRIGSIAPKGSPWDKTFKKIGREWAKITKQKVKLKIYPGGIAGSEVDMIKKMDEGTLGGAALVNDGIAHIYRDIYVLLIPWQFTSDKEFNDVFAKMKPFFEKEIEKKGFKVVGWSLNGWSRLFSKNPVFYPGDLKKQKLSFTAENPDMAQAWEVSGFQLAPGDFKDLMMNLETGKVTSFFLLPFVAIYGEYYTLARNMCTLKVFPLIGGILLSKETWKNIPRRYKKQMIKVARRYFDDLYQEVKKLEEEAIEKMEEYDLIRNKLPVDAPKTWQDAAGKIVDELIGKSFFSKEVYDRVQQYIKEYRRKAK